VKLDRLHRLQALLMEQQQAFNAGCVGRTLPVLLEKPGRQSGQMIGRSPTCKASIWKFRPADPISGPLWRPEYWVLAPTAFQANM
jgi:tRNA-2-methylthio-N6-dimethylallyladenosine synthase